MIRAALGHYASFLTADAIARIFGTAAPGKCAAIRGKQLPDRGGFPQGRCAKA
jgi:hypothetical protein